MFQFKFESNIANVNKRMSNMVARQLPYATSRALNETAKKMVKYNRLKMKRTFDNANNYTLNAFYYKPAKKNDLSVTVRRKDQPTGKHYLEVQDEGGKRPRKAVETKFKYGTAYPGIIQAVLPTSRTGGGKNNMLMSQANKVLAGLKMSYSETAYTKTKKSGKTFKTSGTRYFVGDRSAGKNKTAGIYRVTGRGKPQKMYHILDYLPSYRKKTNFSGDMNKISRVNYPRELKKWLRQAMRTARL